MRDRVYVILLFVTIMLAMSIVCSCGSSNSISKQELSMESGRQANRKDTASFNENIKKVESENVTEEIEEFITVYDTSKTADSATGKPPILSETKRMTKREFDKSNQEDKSTSLNQSTALNDQDKIAIKTAVEESKQRQETTVPRQIGGMFWALAVLVVLIIAGWFIYRWRIKVSSGI